MEIETPKPETEVKKQVLIYNPLIKHDTSRDLKVMRIELDDKFTRIDFVHHASRIYEKGGWVQIHKGCFIRPVGTGMKLRMVKAINIPIAPKKHYYKTTRDCFYYTLYFPALPKDVKEIDIIEMETSDPSFFNFYGVSVNKIKTEVIVVPN